MRIEVTVPGFGRIAVESADKDQIKLDLSDVVLADRVVLMSVEKARKFERAVQLVTDEVCDEQYERRMAEWREDE